MVLNYSCYHVHSIQLPNSTIIPSINKIPEGPYEMFLNGAHFSRNVLIHQKKNCKQKMKEPKFEDFKTTTISPITESTLLQNPPWRGLEDRD